MTTNIDQLTGSTKAQDEPITQLSARRAIIARITAFTGGAVQQLNNIAS